MWQPVPAVFLLTLLCSVLPVRTFVAVCPLILCSTEWLGSSKGFLFFPRNAVRSMYVFLALCSQSNLLLFSLPVAVMWFVVYFKPLKYTSWYILVFCFSSPLEEWEFPFLCYHCRQRAYFLGWLVLPWVLPGWGLPSVPKAALPGLRCSSEVAARSSLKLSGKWKETAATCSSDQSKLSCW